MGTLVTEVTSVTNASTHITGYAAASKPPRINVHVQRLLENVRTRNLTSNPNWRRAQLELGYAPISDYDASWIDRQFRPGFASWWDKNTPSSGRSCECDFRLLAAMPRNEPIYSQWGKSDFRWTNLTNQALTRMYERVAEMDLAVPELLWETRKTIAMFQKMVQTILETARDLRRFRFRAAARRLGIGKPLGANRRRTFSQNWMEYRYGWLPLYYSAYGAMVGLYNLFRKPIVRCVRGRAVSESTSTGEWLYSGYAGDSVASNESLYSRPPSTVQWRVRKRATSRHTVECGIIVELESLTKSSLTSFGLTNPSQVWAIVPMSWFADWWVDVTGFLTQFGALLGKKVRGYYRTRTARYSTKCTVPYLQGPVGSEASKWTWAGYGSSYDIQHGWVERRVSNHPPLAGLILGSGLNGLSRFLDVVSLLRGTLKN